MMTYISHGSIPFAFIGMVAFIAYTFCRDLRIFTVATLSAFTAYAGVTALLVLMVYQFGFRMSVLESSRYLVFAWFIMTFYFIAEFRYRIRLLGSIVMPVALTLILISVINNRQGTGLGVHDGSLTTFIHMGLMFIGLSLMFLSFAASVLYMIKANALKNHLFEALDGRLPSLVKLKRLMESAFNFGFPALTFGIIFGVIYAGSALQAGWIFDGKIIWGLINWFIYSALFFLRQSNLMNQHALARGIIILFLFSTTSFLLSEHQLIDRDTLPDNDNFIKESIER